MNSQKRIDSFFKKSDSDTPKKKQCQEKDVKENEVPEASKSKPITKNPPSTDSADSSSNINLAKISRRFHPEWKDTFPWIHYADGKMFCLVCQECPQKSNDSSSFVSTGCSNFSLKSHARSTGHIQAQEAIRAKERPLEAPLPRAFLLVDEEVRQKMEKLFDVAYMRPSKGFERQATLRQNVATICYQSTDSRQKLTRKKRQFAKTTISSAGQATKVHKRMRQGDKTTPLGRPLIW